MKEYDAVILKCTECGSEKFNKPSENHQYKDGEMLECSKCGHLNDYTELKNAVVKLKTEEIRDDLVNQVKDIFKGFGK